MPSLDAFQGQPAESEEQPSVRCDACQSVLDSPGRDGTSFLLVDHLTVPLIGCDDHLEQFTSVCGFTTEDTAALLQHRPAGGIQCPGCRLAVHNPSQPMIPVSDGVVVVPACPDHQTDTIDRFHTGLRTQRQLTTALDPSHSV